MGEWERKYLDRMLELPFPGRDAIRVQLETALFRTIDDEGCFAIQVGDAPAAEVLDTVPVSLYGDNCWGELFVFGGKVTEVLFFVYTEDGRVPEPHAMVPYFCQRVMRTTAPIGVLVPQVHVLAGEPRWTSGGDLRLGPGLKPLHMQYVAGGREDGAPELRYFLDAVGTELQTVVPPSSTSLNVRGLPGVTWSGAGVTSLQWEEDGYVLTVLGTAVELDGLMLFVESLRPATSWGDP